MRIFGKTNISQEFTLNYLPYNALLELNFQIYSHTRSRLSHASLNLLNNTSHLQAKIHSIGQNFGQRVQRIMYF